MQHSTHSVISTVLYGILLLIALTTEIAHSKEDVSTTNHIQLTNNEKIWLKAHPIIRIASDPNWAPIEYVDDEGNHLGLSADFLKRLEKMLGIKFEYVTGQSWMEMINNFRKGEIDLFTSLNRTPEREKYMHFSGTYTRFPIGIFGGPDMPFINNMAELHNKKTGVVNGYASQELLETNFPEIKLVKSTDPVAALDLLSRGKIDAYVGNILVTSYYIAQLGYSHIKVVAKTPYQYEQSMGVRKDWPVFVSILNKALEAIPESEKNAIYKKWIGVRFEQGFDYALLWKILLVVVVLFALFTYSNRKLAALNRQLIFARDQEEHARKTVELANTQLKAVDKLKSMFIASMSHELRTPLNAIIGFSGLLDQGILGELDEKQKDSIQRINRAGTHLLSLISEVIDISRIEAGRLDIYPEPFSLKALVDEAVESIRPMANTKGIKLEINAEYLPEVVTDRKRILQCLLNYLSNAVKYSEHGKVTLSVMVTGEMLTLSVTDTGIGIAEEDIVKLFVAFERMESHLRIKAGGTGLGLYLTKKIVEELLHGKVSVESRINEGSTFMLVIPVKVSK